ncbi:hypothetical protein QF028_002718 [Neobacillus sp. B4I6]|uniref:hypothetical protein n=1 Tax=Neobacillus sp. B4I6 TaxID=3373925 RepID=UPI003D1C946E
MCTLYQYQNRRPDDNQILNELGLKKVPFIYLTATKKMSKIREGIIPEVQTFRSRQTEKPKKQALFGDVIKGWVKQEYRSEVAGGLEENTILVRTLEEIVTKDEKLLEVLKKDRASILQTLKELAVKKIDLTIGFPQDLQETFLDPALENLLPDIQKQFYYNLRSEGKFLFEELALEFIDNKFINKFGESIKIVMEGFTFFTPLQKHFVKVCLKNRVEVSFLVPNNPEQMKGFEIIQRTYSGLPGLKRIFIVTKVISDYVDLQHLQKQIFSTQHVPFSSETNHVSLQQYPNREQELLAILKMIDKCLIEGYAPSDIAIVMRRKSEFLFRLSDLLQMHPINYNGEQIKLPVSPRMLLLTPVGRFVLTLYEIWKDNQLYLEADQFETLIGSGWLGAKHQDLTPKFRAVKYQFFNECNSKEDWMGVLDSLIPLCRNRRSHGRLSIGILDQRMIKAWKEVINLLDQVCSKLFSTEDGAIGEHIDRLQEQLKGIIPDDLRQSERFILEKIMDVFQQLVDEYTIDLNSEEFSRTLHALVSDKNKDDVDDTDNNDPLELKVYSPETIDGVHEKVVIYLGVDNQHVPAMYSESWPFYKDDRDEHLEKERYMFLTVLRAAKEHLYLTFSLQDANRSFQPSAYLKRILEITNSNLVKFTVEDILDMENAPTIPNMPAAIPATRSVYDLIELAHYGLCPARYRLELLHLEARLYRMEWQLQFVAQGEWLNQIFQRLQQESDKIRKKNEREIKQYLIETISVVEPDVRGLFPALSPITWHGIKNKVRKQLIDYHFKIRGPHLTGVRGSSLEVFTVMNDEEETIDIEFEVPNYWETTRFDVPILDAELHSEWLLPSDPENNEEGFLSIDDIQLFPSLGSAVSWWRSTISGYFHKQNGVNIKQKHIQEALAVFDDAPEYILEWISGIENNKFPKNPGTHCNKCPVRLECLGIVIENEEVSDI